MERAFKDAAHDAIDAKKYRQFFEVVSGCDTEAASSLSKILPALTEEMVQGLDSDVFIKAMNMTLKSAQESHPYDCLNQLHSLLSIARNLEKKDPRRALAMKCLIWPALDKLSGACGPDEVEKLREVKKLQLMALLPELSAELLGSLPGSLQGDLLCVKVDQIMNWPGNENKLVRLLRHGALQPLIEDPDLASGLESLINDALNQLPDDQWPSSEVRTELVRPNMSEIPQADLRTRDFRRAMDDEKDLSAAARVIRDFRGPSRAKNARELFLAISAKLEEVGVDVQTHTTSPPIDEEAARKRIAVVREMAVVLLRTGEPHHIETAERIFKLVDPEPKHFIQLLLREGLGIAGYSLSVQMVRALPMLCDGDHLVELAIIMGSNPGQEFVAQLEQLLIQRLIAGEPSHGEAARIILAQLGMWSEKDALALLNTGLEKIDLRSPKLPLALLVLCSVKPSSGLDSLLEEDDSRWLITQIAMNCFDDGNPSAVTVALLFEALAHRLDLSDWMTDPTRILGVAQRMAMVKLDDQVVQGFHEWAPGWKSLLLISLDRRFCNPAWLAAAVAAEASSGILQRLHSLKRPEAHGLLNAMMSARLPGTDTPLFPAETISYVMRTFMIDHSLAVDPKWIRALPDEQRMRWWKAMVLVFSDLPDEERMRFSVQAAAFALLQSLEEVQKELGVASLAEIKRYFNVKN